MLALVVAVSTSTTMISMKRLVVTRTVIMVKWKCQEQQALL